MLTILAVFCKHLLIKFSTETKFSFRNYCKHYTKKKKKRCEASFLQILDVFNVSIRFCCCSSQLVGIAVPHGLNNPFCKYSSAALQIHCPLAMIAFIVLVLKCHKELGIAMA